MSDKQMVSVPRGTVENAAELLQEYNKCSIARDLRALLAQPADQHQGEPVGEVVAFGKGLHEIAWAAGRMPKLGAKLYTSADPAEVERLRDENRRLHEAGEFLDGVSQGIEDKLRAQLAELTEAFSESQEEVVKRGKMVAERDALLREVRPSCHPKHFAKIDVALSASAEPSAPIAWHVGGNGYDRICFEKPDDLPGRPCIQAIHDQRQLIDLLKRYDLRDEDVPPDERGHGIPGTSFQRLNALANEGE